MSNSSSSGGGCFSGISRLLLCKGSLQTHPSDEIILNPIEFDPHFLNKGSKNLKVEEEEAAPVTVTPGVVARLMGLDSLPISNKVPKTPEIVTRSRSVNFMDYLLELDLSQTQHQQHRRVRTSVSFREVPTVLNHQNHHDFFLLYLDNVEESKKNGSKLRKSEVGLEDEKQKKVDNSKNKDMINKEKNQRSQKLVSNNRKVSRFGNCRGEKEDRVSVKKAKNKLIKPINQKEVLVESKVMKKIKNQRSNKQDSSSPVPFSAGKKSSQKTNNINSRKITSEDNEHRRVVKNDYIRAVEKLYKFTEEDIKESNWVAKSALEFESYEEICVSLGQQVVDVLVEQVVEELVEFEN